MFVAIAEAGNDDGLERADGAVRDAGGRGDEGEEPGLRVLEGGEELVGFELRFVSSCGAVK